MTVRLREVAERAGVSISTVSRMLSNDVIRPVAPATQERIREAMRELNWEPKRQSTLPPGRVARGSQDIYRIGLVVGLPLSELSAPFLTRILQGVQREASRINCQLQFTRILHTAEEEDYRVLTGSEEVDGFIFAGETEPTSHLIDAERSVIIELGGDQLRYGDNVRADIIASEKRVAMHGMVALLAGKGRRRMGFLGPPPDRDERGEAFMHALARYGLPFEPAWYRHAPWGTDEAYPVAHELLELHRGDLDAIVCANDLIAIAALRAAKTWGLNVPGDLAITGFDDFAFARDLDPPLTTIHLPLELMGELATRKLIERLEHPDWPPIIHIVPTTIVERISSGTNTD